MIEKLKNILEVVKGAILYILAPVGILIGYIWFLKAKTNDLADQLGQSKVDKEIVKSLEQKKEAEYEADSATLSYTELRDKYKSEHPDDGGGPSAA